MILHMGYRLVSGQALAFSVSGRTTRIRRYYLQLLYFTYVPCRRETETTFSLPLRRFCICLLTNIGIFFNVGVAEHPLTL